LFIKLFGSRRKNLSDPVKGHVVSDAPLCQCEPLRPCPRRRQQPFPVVKQLKLRDNKLNMLLSSNERSQDGLRLSAIMMSLK